MKTAYPKVRGLKTVDPAILARLSLRGSSKLQWPCAAAHPAEVVSSYFLPVAYSCPDPRQASRHRHRCPPPEHSASPPYPEWPCRSASNTLQSRESAPIRLACRSLSVPTHRRKSYPRHHRRGHSPESPPLHPPPPLP